MGETWPLSLSREEAEKEGSICPRVQVGSVHASGETYGLSFEKEEAVTLWSLLKVKVELPTHRKAY